MRSWEGLVVAARVPARNRFTRHISLRMAEGLGVASLVVRRQLPVGGGSEDIPRAHP